MDKPGQIIYFDHKGEVMEATSFNPGANYGDPEPSGGFGMHEIGNRGTHLGLNMYANTNTKFCSPSSNESKKYEAPSKPSSLSKYAPTEDVDEDEASNDTSILFPKVLTNNKPSAGATNQAPLPPCLATGTAGSETARDELDLLAKLIGTDVKVDQQESHKSFRILEMNKTDDPKDDAKSEANADAQVDALEFDIKGTARKRDNLINKIARDMEQSNASNEDIADDDLLALMDKAL